MLWRLDVPLWVNYTMLIKLVKGIAHTINQGYRVLKHIHGRIQPALADQAPGLAKATKQLMNSYEIIKNAVQGIDSIGQTFAGNLRQL